MKDFLSRRELLRLMAFSGVGLANASAIGALMSSCAVRSFDKSRKVADSYGVTIMADGLRADLFKEMLDAGELPNIKKHIVDRGTFVENCVGTFPSTSGPAHLPFINGCLPGSNNLPGLRWIDRKKKHVRDYCTIESILFNNDFPIPNYTLYEMLAGERTVCIFDFVSRGASEVHRPSAKTLWFMLTAHSDQTWVTMDQESINIFVNTMQQGDTPRYSFVWLPAVDHLGHFSSSKSDKVRDRVRGIDKQVLTIMETLYKKGIYDKTLVSFVADHGLRDTQNNNDIRQTIADYGFKVLDNLTSNDNYNSLYEHNAARGVSGNGFSLLYFAKKENWRGFKWYDWYNRPEYGELREFPLADSTEKIDLIENLRKETPIKLLMTREKEDRVLLFSKNGHAIIERDIYLGLRYSFSDEDPLGYTDYAESAALINGEFHDKDKWFAATTGTDYPDGLLQIIQLFDSDRCGDIVVSSEPGWDFMVQGHRATHGGLEKAEMMVPCVIAGPNIQHKTIPFARTVDLYPTYLKFLGFPNYDGEVINAFL